MTLLLPRVAGLLAAVVVTAAAGLAAVAVAPSASAAACTTATGVTIVADFKQLGGGVPTACVADGGGQAASALFGAAGLGLTYAQRQPGFVCRVAGKPASDPCVNTSPASAYWGLWWSDGDPGSTWTYSSLGVTSLKIPAGGLVALAWDQVDGDALPGAPATRPVAASAPPAAPAPAPAGGSGDGARGGSGTSNGGTGTRSSGTRGSGDADTPDATPTPDADETPAPEDAGPSTGAGRGAGPGDRAKPSRGQQRDGRELDRRERDGRDRSATDEDDAPEATPSPDVATVTDADPELLAGSEATPAGEDGLPAWVAPALIVVLFGGAGGAWWWRRRAADLP